MSEKRKTIFREALFIVPFMLIVSVVSIAAMFFVGRTPLDVAAALQKHVKSDKTMSIEDYSEYSSVKYELKYYYGDDRNSVKFAEYSYNSKGDDPIQSLILYEPRDGFDAGYYKIEWFHDEEYVTYAALDNEKKTKLYFAKEAPLMYNLIESYSWKAQAEFHGAGFEPSKGYKPLGIISLYLWDCDGRKNILWGIGGNPLQFYSYIANEQNEYKKVIFYR